MNGTIAVGGMALAEVHIIAEQHTDVGRRAVEQVEAEEARLDAAVRLCAAELSKLICQLQEEGDSDHADILDFQLLLLEDDHYIGRISRMVREERVNCEYAVSQCSQVYRQELSSLDNPYLNERAADITDIEKRLLRALSQRDEAPVRPGPKIAAAVDLTPSQVVELGRQGLRGIVLEKGGLSSHCVILARSMGIPCIIGVAGLLEQVRDGQSLLLDAEGGRIIVEPTLEEIQAFEQYEAAYRAEQKELEQFRHASTATADGQAMKVYANITSELEVPELLKQGGEGVGLLRTELLYMERESVPDEDSQYEAYSAIITGLAGRPLIVRTLDVGGDKHIPYLNIPQEDNPFLGYRAIRYCLDHPEVFHPQLAAILRAAALGPVQLMLPMVATMTEVERARDAVAQVRAELKERGTESGPISLGMMVETPAAAIMANQFAGAVDFFSIGTNDLTQYLLAADRNNAKVAGLNSYFQPALLHMVDHICQCAHRHGIEVDICGQAGEMDELIPLWVGMGVDNLSVSVPSIPRVRRTISQCGAVACRRLADRALQCSCAQEVMSCVKEEVKKWS